MPSESRLHFHSFKLKHKTIGKKYSPKYIRTHSVGTLENSFLKIYVMCPIGWHLLGIVHVKVHVFPALGIYTKLKLEELVLNYVICTMCPDSRTSKSSETNVLAQGCIYLNIKQMTQPNGPGHYFDSQSAVYFTTSFETYSKTIISHIPNQKNYHTNACIGAVYVQKCHFWVDHFMGRDATIQGQQCFQVPFNVQNYPDVGIFKNILDIKSANAIGKRAAFKTINNSVVCFCISSQQQPHSEKSSASTPRKGLHGSRHGGQKAQDWRALGLLSLGQP